MKEQLLAATIRVVSDQGWRGVTTRRIAEAAGLNEVTLFRHFGSKDALIREALAWEAERAPIPMLPDHPGDPTTELVQWARQHYAHLLEVRSHIRKTIGEFEASPEVASWSRRVPKQLHDTLERYVLQLRAQGVTRGDWDPRAATSLLLGALFADAISRDFIPDSLPTPLEGVPGQYVHLFLRAIGYGDN